MHPTRNGTGAASAIETMVEMNNRGVELLQEGNFLFARQAFYQSIQIMHEALDEQEQLLFSSRGVSSVLDKRISESLTSLPWGGTDGATVRPSPSTATTARQDSRAVHGDDAMDESDDEGLRPKESTSAASAAQVSKISNSMTTGPPQDQQLHSFLRPILLDRSHIVFTISQAPLMQLSICLIFNMAIANHAMALSSRTSPHRAAASCVQDALHLYSLAYNLQLEGGVEVSWLHTLGMVNNIGQLQAYAGYCAQAKETFDVLWRLLLSGEASSRPDPTTNNKEDDSQAPLYASYVESFLDNVYNVVLCNHSMISSPAA